MVDFNFVLVSPVVCLSAYALLSLLLERILRGNGPMQAIVAMFGLGTTGFTLWRLWTL